MTANAILQFSAYLVLLLLAAWPLGSYLARVYDGDDFWAARILGPTERLIYRLIGVNPEAEMDWKGYTLAVLASNLLGCLVLYGLMRLQGVLPLDPAGFPGVSPLVALNTAVSFASNTNWQAYGGETTMSLLTQMLGLTVQNFFSAATGMAVLAAFVRGLARRESKCLGNFWVDLTRSILYVLAPLSLVLALALVWQGVPQTFAAKAEVRLLDSAAVGQGDPGRREIALGPVASQVAIKQLGTNGGGFYNVNSAHPLENPTPLSNLLEILAILLIPAAQCLAFGRMVGDRRQGWAVLAAMSVLLSLAYFACAGAEQAGNPRLAALGVDQAAAGAPAAQAGGNMEGKEVRFGIVDSSLWAVATTAASNGSVNAMHDSFTPLGGLVPMLLMQLGEVVFGGVGCGLYGMLVFVLVAVFVAGLMIGRTPEYLGKKIGPFETKMAALVILVPPFLVLLGTAGAVIGKNAAAAANPGLHAFSEILYGFSSMGNNNGSAFAGLSAAEPYYALAGAAAMFLSRWWLIVPVLAMAGSLAGKKATPQGPGVLPTHTPLFVFFLIVVVLVVGALTFIPSLALGPVAEHLVLNAAAPVVP